MKSAKRLSITPKSDIIFKNIFGAKENKKILESFLEAVLNEKVEVAFVEKSKELNINNINDKVGVLDIQVILTNGTVINIEMQKNIFPYYHKRVLFYLSKLILGQIKKKDEYEKIQKVISINVLDYKIPWIIKYISKYEIYDVENDQSKINGATIYFLQIPRFEVERNLLAKNIKYEDVVKSQLDEWMVYLSYKNMEVLDMVRVQNLDIEEAIKLYEALIERDEVVQLYESRAMAEADRRAWFTYKQSILDRRQKVIDSQRKRMNDIKNEIKDKENEIKDKENEIKDKENEIKDKENEIKNREKNLKTDIIRNLLQQNIADDIILKITGISKEMLEQVKSNQN